MSAQPEAMWRLSPMHPSHLPQVLEIEKAVYPFPWTDQIFRDCLNVGYSSWVVTDTLGEVLGYALMSMAVGEAHVLNLCVAPEHQRQGIAEFIMKHLLMVARAGAVTLVLLEVRVSNRPAQKLYEKFGFARIGVRKAYYPAANGREDALVLGFDLV